MILGLVGGVGSGKSAVTDILKDEYGFEILYTDDIAKKLEQPGEPVYNELCRAFGTCILSEGKAGEYIDKKRFADIIYSDEEALNKAGSIIHPAVWKYVGEYIDKAAGACDGADGKKGVRIAVETALPDENFKNLCDVIWYIFASEKVRTERLMQSRGYTREKCRSIIDSQKKREELYKEADERIENSLELENTKKQIAALMKKYNDAEATGSYVCG